MTHNRDTFPDLPEPAQSLLREPDLWAGPPPQLQSQTLRAIQRESPSAGIGAPVPLRGSGKRPAQPARRAASRRLWLAVAAAALAVLTVGTAVAMRSNPADATVTLTATALAPGASGRAEFRSTGSGFRIDLDTEGLPPSPPGTYYQAWLKNAAGQLVTIGTFHARDGGRDIVLWSAVDPRDYPTLTVTVQQEGAGAASSGKVVLQGTVR